MMRNKGGALVLLLILCFATVSISQIRAVEAEDTIYINSDGSVDGTELIQRNDDIYIFLSDISGNIVVSRDFITIDGSGYSLKGSGDSSQRGISLTFRKNVTVTNLVIVDWFTGIYCKPGAGTATNITILNNYIHDCDIGIEFFGTNDNLVMYNTFKNNSIDIALNYVLGENRITHNNLGSYIQVWMSNQPTVDMNYWADYNGTDNDGDGIGDSAYFHHDILQDSHPLIEPVPSIPEFPSWAPMPIMLIVVLAVAAIYRRCLNKKNQREVK
jgi:parallel beta-helix repeat protein